MGFSTHIVGGEITYSKLSGNNYKITMKLYRDCFNGVAPYDDPAYVFVYNSSGALLQTLTFGFPGSAKLPVVLTSPCLVPPSNICVEEAVYTGIVALPPIVGGYDLVYQRCCRNNTILNLIQPGNVGSTYLAHIPGSEVVTKNSSPPFTQFPPLFLCVNSPIFFDHSAIDPDGDSLVYQLCDPFDGADTQCPQPGSNPNCGPPVAPPYNQVPWNTGYSGGYPLNSSPALAIDPKTGLLTGTPTKVGQFVVGVCVYEYRNGVFLSVNKRDFQFNVLACLNPVAAIPSQQVFCDGLSVNFQNNSINATGFQWDFGDPNSGASNLSTLTNPVHVFSDSGVYKVRLVAYNNTNNCKDTAYTIFYVYPLLKPDFVAPPPSCLGEVYDFSAAGSFDPAATFQWNFGPDALPQQSNLQNPQGVQFSKSGNYSISLTISQFGCLKTITKPMVVYPKPKAIISSANQFCSGMNLQFQNLSTNALSYFWDFGDTSVTSDQSSTQNPSYNYPDSGKYQVQLIAYSNSNLCNDTVMQDFYVYPMVSVFFTPPASQCFKNNSFSFQAGGIYTSNATFLWDFGPDATPTQSTNENPVPISFNSAGKKPVQITIHQFSCHKSYTDTILVIPEPIPLIGIQSDPCGGLQVQFDNQSTHADAYFWDFGDVSTLIDTSSAFNPQYVYSISGAYQITLIASNTSGMCVDSTHRTFNVYPLLKPEIKPVASQCIDHNIFDFFASGSYGSGALFSWDFGSSAYPQFSSLENPKGVVYDSVGTFALSLSISENGCTKSVVDSARILPMPEALFSMPPLEGCIPLAVQFADSSKSATVLNYMWSFGDGSISLAENPLHIYQQPGTFDVGLTVKTTNGCIDTSVFILPKLIKVYPLPIAGYELDSIEKSAFDPTFEFYNLSQGAKSCKLIFGDGDSSLTCNVSHTYPDTGTYVFTQIVSNIFGCMDTISGKIRVRPEYKFFVPNAFTPNDDLVNDQFKPLMMGVIDFKMYIFNRWGELLYEGNQQDIGWDGTFKGKPCQQDVYTYLIKLENVFEKKYSFVGSATLVR